MGKNNIPVIIILIVVLGLGVGIYLWYTNLEKPKHNWYETYKNDRKEPYDTYVIAEMLEKYFPEKKFNVIRKPLHESLPRNTGNNYVFIGSGMFLDSLSELKLLDYVHRGNNAFIAVPNIPYTIEDTLNLSTCEYYYPTYSNSDSVARLNFYQEDFKTNQPYEFFYRNLNDTLYYNWTYIIDTCINPQAKPQFYANISDTLPNYMSVSFGKGYFYIHTTPLAFTNVQLLNKRSVEYAEKVFSFLPKGDIYWDEFSKIPVEYKSEDNNEGGELRWEKSPLYFILSQPALKTAWYLILALVLLFILFRAKRRQRAIPVLIPNTNTSLEFAETIGRIYYLQNDHKKLASQKMKLFLEGIRNRYNIATNTIDDAFMLKLAQKSQVPQKEIERLFENYKVIENQKSINEESLIIFNQSIDNFYTKAK
ncbi:MAG: hypothetical protein POELPBGB_02242 [Bacteroidia bacterium]|nr:hypothetical protein [Bacteroidia bacterium]